VCTTVRTIHVEQRAVMSGTHGEASRARIYTQGMVGGVPGWDIPPSSLLPFCSFLPVLAGFSWF